MTKAIIWCRVSTIAQEYESQKQKLVKTALKDGFKQQDLIYIGEAGASARKMNEVYKKEVDELIQTIDNNPSITAVYVWEVSRLARNKEAFQRMTSHLIRKKIQLTCDVPKLKLLDENREVNRGAELTFDLLITLASQEMDIKEERFKRGKERTAAEGKYIGGYIPFGYFVNKEKDNLIEIDKEKEKVIKKVYDLYEKGYSQPKIAIELPKQGYNNVSLSLVHHILMNEGYTGIRKKPKNAKYERSYPLIITPEQFHRCRQIANQNNTTLSKARNVYYAEHLIKCPTCGAFWGASGSKVVYHCPNAWKPLSVWKVDSHKKEKCTNKSSIVINIIDSILWEVAKKQEALQILHANQNVIDEHTKNAELIRTKLQNIEPRIQKVKEKKDRLLEAYVDGLSKELYIKKSQEITDAITDIRREEKLYSEELAHTEETIEHLKANLNRQKSTYTRILYPEDHSVMLIDSTIKKRVEEECKLSNITDDVERKKLIQLHIKDVEIIPTTIKYPFNGGEKDTKARKIIVHCHQIALNKDLVLDRKQIKNDYIYFTIANGGKGLPIILDIAPLGSEEGWVKGNKLTFYSYTDEKSYWVADIAPTIYESRFVDLPKKEKREKAKQKNLEVIGDRIALAKAPAITGVKYWKLYAMLKDGTLKAEMIAGKYYIDPDELKAML